jgi:hypothetical protein
VSNERRAYPRYVLNAPATYRGAGIEGTGTIADISASGALIQPASPSVALGTPLKVRVANHAGPPGPELPSEVVRMTDAGFAVHFKLRGPEVLYLLRAVLP